LQSDIDEKARFAKPVPAREESNAADGPWLVIESSMKTETSRAT